MKNLKFLAVALTVLMGMSLTSCLSDDDSDNAVDTAHFALVKGGFMGGVTFEDGSGILLTPTQESLAVLYGNTTDRIENYDFGYISYKWLDGQMPNPNDLKREYSIDLKGFMPGEYGYADYVTSLEDLESMAPETAPIVSMNYSGLVPFKFNANTLVLPIIYYMEKKETMLKEHTFSLVAALGEVQKGDTRLTLYLHHDKGADPVKENYGMNISYHAFNIANVVGGFKAYSESELTEIVIKAHEIGQYSSEVNKIPEAYNSYTIKMK